MAQSSTLVDSHGIRDQGRGRKDPLKCSPKITAGHRLRLRPRELSQLLKFFSWQETQYRNLIHWIVLLSSFFQANMERSKLLVWQRRWHMWNWGVMDRQCECGKWCWGGAVQVEAWLKNSLLMVAATENYNERVFGKQRWKWKYL